MSPKGWILAGQEGAVIDSQDQNSSQECEERTTFIQNQISVLERTLTNIHVASGRALENSINRQISIRRDELQIIQRNTSVIVHTSTPNLSLNQHPEVESFFQSAEENILCCSETPASHPHPQPQTLAVLPFVIHQDPEPAGSSTVIGLEDPNQLQPPSRTPLRTIPIIQTPHTPFSDQTSHFNFTESPATMSMDDDQRAEVDQINNEIRTRTTELVTILEMYDPSLYPPAVLKENKYAWIKEAQDAYKSLITYFIQLEERMPTMTPDEVRDGKEARKKVQEAVSKFVLDVNLKVMSLNDQAPPSSSRNLVDNDSDDSSAADEDQAKKVAKAAYDVDREKINEEIKDLSEEINQVEDWSQSSDHEVETAMLKLAEWKKQLKSIKDSFYSMKRIVKSKELDNPNDPDDPLKLLLQTLKMT